MRNTLLVICVLGALAVDVQGQSLPPSKPANPLSVYDSRVWSDVALSRQSAPARPRRVHYCCNLKHALIGAGIGAAIGFAFVRAACDAGDCTTDYIKSMTVMGGILGGLGAFVSRQNSGVPLAPTPIVGDQVSPLQSSRGGATPSDESDRE